MNVHKLCMNCMRECLDENGICSACGAIESEIKTTTKHLPMRSILKGKYLVGSVLGEGGFGITYVGYDLDLEIKVAIKEFCPAAISGREVADGASVVPFGADAAEQYETEKEKFINEAKRLAKFRKLEGVVSVLDYFKENNTAYIVMDYIEGVTLKQHCKMLNKPIPWKTLLDMMAPIIRSLSEIHKAGIIHRDISPDNIMLGYDQRSVYLIDFGTARELNKGTLSAYEKGFYTPWEQISTKKSQGPWTDVYALCATMYHCLTGRKIPVVGDRYGDEAITLPSQYGIQVPEYIEQALVEGLALDPDKRIRSMEELEEKLYRTMNAENVQAVQLIKPEQNVQSNMKEENTSAPEVQKQKKPKVQPVIKEDDGAAYRLLEEYKKGAKWSGWYAFYQFFGWLCLILAVLIVLAIISINEEVFSILLAILILVGLPIWIVMAIIIPDKYNGQLNIWVRIFSKIIKTDVTPSYAYAQIECLKSITNAERKRKFFELQSPESSMRVDPNVFLYSYYKDYIEPSTLLSEDIKKEWFSQAVRVMRIYEAGVGYHGFDDKNPELNKNSVKADIFKVDVRTGKGVTERYANAQIKWFQRVCFVESSFSNKFRLNSIVCGNNAFDTFHFYGDFFKDYYSHIVMPSEEISEELKLQWKAEMDAMLRKKK